MRYLGYIFLLLLSFNGYSQSSIIDDLRDQLKGPLSDSAQVMAKTQLARELIYIDNSEAYLLAQEAISLANEKGLELEGAYAMRILGAVMREYGFYLKGSEILLDAKAIFEKYGDELGVANCYLSLANFYNYLSDHDLAVTTELKAIQIFEKLQASERLGVIYNNIGRSYNDLGKYDSAAFYTRASIAVNESLNNQPLLQSNYRNLGLIYIKTRKFDSAKESFEKVIKLHNELGNYSNKWAAAEAYLGLAKVYMQQNGSREQVESNINTARDLCVTHGYLDILKNVIQTSFEYNQSINNYENIDLLWKTYQNLTDSLLQVERENKRYIVDWYEERIQQESEIADFTLKLGRQKVQIIALIVLVLLIGISLALFVFTNRRVRKVNRLLSHQKKELEKLNQTKSKLFSIVAHDFISPLSNVYSFSRLLVEEREMDESDKKLIIKELNQSVESTISLTKNLLTWARNQLEGEVYNPIQVEVCKLLHTVLKSIQSQASAKQVKVEIQCPGELEIYADPAQLEVVFRNLISNAIKFSHPEQSINIQVTTEEGRVKILFEDKGIGMSDEVQRQLFQINEYSDVRGTAGEKGTGLGLIICREFVEKNKGDILINSLEGKGTAIQLSFPSK